MLPNLSFAINYSFGGSNVWGYQLKKDRLTALAIFWLLGNLVVESSFIPLELIFEHRMYLPLMFLILAGVAWLQRLTMDQEKTARIMVV